MNTKTTHAEAGLAGIFSRLIAGSRKLLARSQSAPLEEIGTLTELIENEIIPRLQMTFPTPQAQLAAAESLASPEYEVDGFVAALLSPQPDDASHFIDQLIASEHSVLQIYRHLLTPAARRLGVMWEEDLCSFADVTIAITKIRHLFIATAPLFPVHAPAEGDTAPTILLTTVPGEQHTFGLYLAVESFRAAGWTVWSGTPRSIDELTALVAREQYDVAGLSVVAERNVEVVARAVRSVRSHSANADIRVILGGRMAHVAPDNLQALGADAVIADADEAIAEAAAMIGLHQRP